MFTLLLIILKYTYRMLNLPYRNYKYITFMKGCIMKVRKKPTSVLLNERNRCAADLYRACADGRIKNLKKLRKQFNESCKQYEARLIEETKLREEKEAKRLAKLNKQNKGKKDAETT